MKKLEKLTLKELGNTIPPLNNEASNSIKGGGYWYASADTGWQWTYVLDEITIYGSAPEPSPDVEWSDTITTMIGYQSAEVPVTSGGIPLPLCVFDYVANSVSLVNCGPTAHIDCYSLICESDPSKSIYYGYPGQQNGQTVYFDFNGIPSGTELTIQYSVVGGYSDSFIVTVP